MNEGEISRLAQAARLLDVRTLSVSEAIALIGCERATGYRHLVRDGVALRVGRHFRIPRGIVAEMMRAQRRGRRARSKIQ